MIPKKPIDVTWTDEQWQAIYEDKKNIIVSAGAGSGKTAVLTERVIRKLKDGVHINQLLILTFTKAAAAEMSDRIRKKIKKEPKLKDELNLLDSSYITTFDSFALSVVKKYHYLINISSKVDIIDSNVILITKEKIMEEIFLELYQQKDEKFLNMIKNFCIKDDDEIRKDILNISNKLDLLSNKKEYLEKYILNYYNEDKIKKDIDNYFNIIKEKIYLIKEKIKEVSYLDNDFANKLEESLNILFESNSYNDVITKLNIRPPISPKGSSDELKEIRSEISNIIKEIKALCFYESDEEIKQSIALTYDTINVIINIILDFTKRVNEYKMEKNCFEFNDIAIMAINIVKEHEEVREELFNSFNEIMIDEYQDTNDLQEEFISMISNHNVYMVGDIKQSIYRFRNANPYIFKEKYDLYSNSNIDKKIDLNKNFRSRNEVLNNINIIFNLIMNQDIGGADYLKEHQMIFGNKAYLKEKLNHSNDLEIYSYNYDKEIGFTKEEIEAFIIAKDIIKKYQDKYQVFDKDTSNLRDISYNDFAIIIDRATNFDLYKKVFSYFGIPTTLLKDEKMNDADDINIIKNLIRFFIVIHQKKYDTEFKYLFTSISRSFLINKSDEEIFAYFYNNNFKESSLYKKCFKISKLLDSISITDLLEIIEDEFSYYDKLITVGDINNKIIKIEKLKELATNLENIGYDIEDFSNYLEELTKKGYTIEYKAEVNKSDSIKIMTIHKSKGLEYPICYFSGLYKKFNISDLKDRFIYDKDFGIIVPYFNEGIGQTIYKELLKDKYLKEEISEKIRLFYVALTRAREKIILVNPISEKIINTNNTSVLPNNIKIQYKSLADIIYSIDYQLSSYKKYINLESLNLTNDYKKIKKSNYKDSIEKKEETIIVKEINNKNNILEEKTFSKKIKELISKKEYNNLLLGNQLHNILELIDFKNPDYSIIDNQFIKEIVESFLSNKILKNINKANIYKEYEFIYSKDNVEYHGIIDLILEYENEIYIIDYKLKNINDKKYIEQLNGYKDYIKTITTKNIIIYLYSFLDKELYEIKNSDI